MKIIGTVLQCLALEIDITCLAVSPDSQLIATGCGTAVYIWGTQNFRLLGQLNRRGANRHKKNIRAVAFHPNGNFLATASDDLKIGVWNVNTRRVVRMMQGHGDIVFDLQFSTDGKQLFTSSADGHVFAWDWRRARMVASLARESSAIKSLALLPQFQRLCVACADGSVGFWDTGLFRKLGGISPDSQWASSRGEATNGGWIDPQRFHTGALNMAKLSPDGLYLATASNDATVKLWNVISLRKHSTSVISYQDRHKPQKVDDIIAFEPRRASLNGEEAPLDMGFTGKLLFTFRHRKSCGHVCFSKDSKFLITSSLDCTIKIWLTDDGEQVYQVNLPYPVADMWLLHPVDDRVIMTDSDGNKSVHPDRTILGRLHIGVQSRLMLMDLIVVGKHGRRESKALAVDRSLTSSTQNNTNDNQLEDVKKDPFKSYHLDSSQQSSTPNTRNRSLHAPKSNHRRVSFHSWPEAPGAGNRQGDDSSGIEYSEISFDQQQAMKRLHQDAQLGEEENSSSSSAPPKQRPRGKGRNIGQANIAKEYLEALLARSHGVDREQLEINMRLYQFTPSLLLKVIASSGNFEPTQVLLALSATPVQAYQLYKCILGGSSIDDSMIEMGFLPAAKNRRQQSKPTQGAQAGAIYNLSEHQEKPFYTLQLSEYTSDDLFFYDTSAGIKKSKERKESRVTGAKSTGRPVSFLPARQLNLLKHLARDTALAENPLDPSLIIGVEATEKPLLAQSLHYEALSRTQYPLFALEPDLRDTQVERLKLRQRCHVDDEDLLNDPHSNTSRQKGQRRRKQKANGGLSSRINSEVENAYIHSGMIVGVRKDETVTGKKLAHRFGENHHHNKSASPQQLMLGIASHQSQQTPRHHPPDDMTLHSSRVIYSDRSHYNPRVARVNRLRNKFNSKPSRNRHRRRQMQPVDNSTEQKGGKTRLMTKKELLFKAGIIDKHGREAGSINVAEQKAFASLVEGQIVPNGKMKRATIPVPVTPEHLRPKPLPEEEQLLLQLRDQIVSGFATNTSPIGLENLLFELPVHRFQVPESVLPPDPKVNSGMKIAALQETFLGDPMSLSQAAQRKGGQVGEAPDADIPRPSPERAVSNVADSLPIQPSSSSSQTTKLGKSQVIEYSTGSRQQAIEEYSRVRQKQLEQVRLEQQQQQESAKQQEKPQHSIDKGKGSRDNRTHEVKQVSGWANGPDSKRNGISETTSLDEKKSEPVSQVIGGMDVFFDDTQAQGGGGRGRRGRGGIASPSSPLSLSPSRPLVQGSGRGRHRKNKSSIQYQSLLLEKQHGQKDSLEDMAKADPLRIGQGNRYQVEENTNAIDRLKAP